MAEIRTLRPEESATAKQLLQDVWTEFFGRHADPFVRNYFADPKILKDLDDIGQSYFSNRGTFLVAVSEGMIVATGALSRIDADTCELCRMFVRADYRRGGIATSLCNELLGFAKQHGYKRAQLSSNRQLTDSHRLYRNLGFQEIPPLIASYAPYAIFMEKML